MEELTHQEETQNTSYAKRPERHHRKPEKVYDTVFYIRQILNTLFIILAFAGAVMYSGLVGDEKTVTMGGIVAIIAVSMKMAECMLRLVRPKKK